MDPGDILDSIAEFIDVAYGNEYTTLVIGLVITSLLVFIDEVDVASSREFWAATCFVFLATLLLYDANENVPFMLAAFIMGLCGAASRHARGGDVRKL